MYYTKWDIITSLRKFKSTIIITTVKANNFCTEDYIQKHAGKSNMTKIGTYELRVNEKPIKGRWCPLNAVYVAGGTVSCKQRGVTCTGMISSQLMFNSRNLTHHMTFTVFFSESSCLSMLFSE